MVHTTKNGRGPKNGNAAQPPLCIAGNTKFKCGSKLVLSEQKGHATYHKPRNRIDKIGQELGNVYTLPSPPIGRKKYSDSESQNRTAIENQFEEKQTQTMDEYSDSQSQRRTAIADNQLSKDLSPPELL